jgi:hypothetical protein
MQSGSRTRKDKDSKPKKSNEFMLGKVQGNRRFILFAYKFKTLSTELYKMYIFYGAI